MHHSARVEGVDPPLETLLSTCGTRGAEPQEGGGIARAWIEHPKVYTVYQCLSNGIRVGGTVVATGDRFF